MNDISVGAVGAALIAGLISLFGLIIGKEQKVSEFRQAWIDELRKCFVAYLVQINAISDLIRMQNSGQTIDASSLASSYRLLNEANHGITFRINPKEKPAKKLIRAMKDFEDLAGSNAAITPDRIKVVEGEFIASAQKLLKFEWNRVKRGESTFVWTKRIIISIIVGLLFFMSYYYFIHSTKNLAVDTRPNIQLMLEEK